MHDVHLGQSSCDGGYRDAFGDIVARGLATQLVDGHAGRARIDIAPEHARGRIVYQSLRAGRLCQLVLTAQPILGLEGGDKQLTYFPSCSA